MANDTQMSFSCGKPGDNLCPLCGDPTFEVAIASTADRLTGIAGVWQLRRCKACRQVYTWPSVSAANIGAFYGDDYPPHAVRRRRRSKTVDLIRRLLLWPYIARHGDPDMSIAPFGSRAVLDVGCGGGGALSRFAETGWFCTGVDSSPVAIAATRAALPEAETFLGTIDSIPKHRRFDLITLFHVLEHVPDPNRLLGTVRGLLSPGGRAIVEVPNIASGEARLFGQAWRGIDAPRHYLHFSPDSLERLLETIGFAVESRKTVFFCSTISESLMVTLLRWRRKIRFDGRLAKAFYAACYVPAGISYALGNCGVMRYVVRVASRPTAP
jgi:SAM-dependent methyltransferase